MQGAQEWSEKGESDEYHDPVKSKFDQGSALVDGVDEFETQATRRANETVHAPKRHMVWWRNSWWIRIGYGPHLRTARNRRRAWRVATRAVTETKEEKWEEREKGSVTRVQREHVACGAALPKQCNCNNSSSSKVHVVVEVRVKLLKQVLVMEAQ